MGTQGPGRRRMPNREKLTAEDDALNQIAREAEARLAAKRAARAEAREIRMKELERQQKEMSDEEERMSVGSRGSLRPSDYGGFLGSGSRASSRASSARASPVVEERPERDFLDKGSRTASTLSAATLASLGGASSRRGSCDTSFSVETEASIREMKDSLAEAEEKYRKAMVSNAQLHNEKSTLMYQVETLREELSDLEELLWETRRHCDDQTKAYERERERHSVLQFQFKEMSETLRKTEELLTNHGVFVSLDVTTNGEAGQDEAEDDVSAESGPQLACAPHSDRQSVLGEVGEQQTANSKMFHCCQTFESSPSLNIVPTNPHTSTHANDRTAMPTTRKPPRHQDPTKKKHPQGNLLQNEGMSKMLKRSSCQADGPEGRPEAVSPAVFTAETLLLMHHIQGRAESEKTPAEKLLKSRLVRPRVARDIILHNRAALAGLRWRCETPPPDKDRRRNCSEHLASFSDPYENQPEEMMQEPRVVNTDSTCRQRQQGHVLCEQVTSPCQGTLGQTGTSEVQNSKLGRPDFLGSLHQLSSQLDFQKLVQHDAVQHKRHHPGIVVKTGSGSVLEAVDEPRKGHGVSVDSSQRCDDLSILESLPEEFEGMPGAPVTTGVATSCPGDVSLLKSDFAEPIKFSQVAFKPQKVGRVVPGGPDRSGEDPDELQRSSASCQRSKFRSVLEEVADEIKAMVVPELLVRNLRASRTIEDMAGWEPSGVGLDSCEEAEPTVEDR